MLLFLVVLCGSYVGCGKPSVSLTTIPKDGKPVFIIDAQHVNSVYKVSVWNAVTGEYLWVVQNGGSPFLNHSEIQYGSTPVDVEIKQLYPANNETPVVPNVGDTVGVYVLYSYDDPLPSANMATFVFDVVADGQWSLTDSTKVLHKPNPYEP